MLKPPPRNEVGQVVPHDHSEILPEDGVIRRISNQFIVVDSNGKPRVSTKAFHPSSPERGGGLPVDLQREIESAGVNAREFVTTPEWIGSARLTAKQFRAEGFKVGFDPLPPENPFHGEVWGQFTRGQINRLLAPAEWFVEIPSVPLIKSND